MNRPFLAALLLGLAACQSPIDAPPAAPLSPAPGAPAAGITPAVLDLGTLPGGVISGATDLNDQGVVVGSSETVGAVGIVSHAFVWTTGGGMTDLGTLGGQLSTATGINNSFEIVGTTTTAAAPFVENVPFFWDPVGGMVALPGLGSATDINDLHVITGCATIDATGPQIVRWDLVSGGWTVTGLGLPPGGSGAACARAIDNAGRLVGSDLQTTGFFYSAGIYQSLGAGSVAYGLSPTNRRVAGEVGLDPALWPNFNLGGVFGLGYLYAPGSGAALDVNSAAQVVGETAPPRNTIGSARAFYWDCRQGMLELPTIAGVPNSSASAWAVNAAGQSAGVSTWLPGLPDRHAVLWANPAAPQTVVSLPYSPSCVIPPVVSYIPKKFLNDGIISRPGFDATQIDPTTVTIGDGFRHITPIARRAPGGPPQFQLRDINGDGLTDMQVSFSKAQMVADGTLTRQSFELVVSWIDPTGLPQSGKYPIRVR